MIVKRGMLTDHYVEDDRSVVMVNESVLGLSPIATTILEAVPAGARVTLQAVTQHVLDTYGPPGRAESAEHLTRQQVWDLAAHQVLVVVDEGGLRDVEAPVPGQLLSDRERSAAVSELRKALRHLRSGAAGKWELPDSVTPKAFVASARAHHVIPYLDAHRHHLALPGQASSELAAMAGHQQAGATLLAADLSVIINALGAEGVRALAFKGVTLATQAYGDFAVRGAGDLDLLVSPEDVSLAHRVIREAGWEPAPGYPAPGASWAWRHHLRIENELTLSGARSTVDLHWHLVPMRGVFPDFDRLWERRTICSVDGHPIPTLAPYDALAHSAGHAAKDRWRWLRSLLDVHVLVADRDTWAGAPRPLRRDQLLSVGLAVAEFGLPPGAPPVVRQAMREVDEELRSRVHREQDETAPQHRPLTIPGINFARRVRGIGSGPEMFVELRRLLSESMLPSRFTTDEPSPHSIVAVPRVLKRRTADVVFRLRAKRETSQDRPRLSR